MAKLITITETEYKGLKRFRDDMAWYWRRYRESKDKRWDYDGFMTYNQINGAPDARLARLAYWYQLVENNRKAE